MLDFFNNNYTMIIVVLGTVLLGVASGTIGTISILQKKALLGDALSHATLPGVVLAFMFTGYKDIEILLFGAIIAAFVSVVLMDVMIKYTKVKNDAALALVLAGFFGLGQVFLVSVQSSGNASQAGLDKFIFGQAATILRSDVYLLGVIALAMVILLLLFWKEIKHYVFNHEHFQTLGFSSKIMNILILSLIIIVVVIGIRTVGVILMSALLVAPGVAARQWTNKLSINVFLAGIFGLISGALGAYISAVNSAFPTGPIVVVFLSFFVVISILFSPKRGLVYQLIQEKKYREKMIKYKPLIHLYSGNEISLLSDDDISFLNDQQLVFWNDDGASISKNGMEILKSLLGGGSRR